MDPLAALSFAANIAQFVDYVCHVLKVGKQIRRHGMAESTEELEQTAKLLEHQVARITALQGVDTGLEKPDKVSGTVHYHS